MVFRVESWTRYRRQHERASTLLGQRFDISVVFVSLFSIDLIDCPRLSPNAEFPRSKNNRDRCGPTGKWDCLPLANSA